MKALFAVIFCAVAGEAVSWSVGAVSHSAPLLKNLVHPSTKGFAYAISQYNHVLPASYSYGIRPQWAYPISEVVAFAPLPGLPAYYPVSSASYVPASSIIFSQQSQIAPVQPQPVPSPPSAPNAPIAPSAPSPPKQQNQPSLPLDQSNGDADTTVIDSAEFLKSHQGQHEAPKSNNANQLESARCDTVTSNQDKQPKESMTPLYRNPQITQLASFSVIPQLPVGIPQYSQFPQRNPFLQLPELPELPLPEFPEFPQLPQFPPSHSSPPQAPSRPLFPPVQDAPSQQQHQFPQLSQFPPSEGASLQPLLQIPSFPQSPPSQGSSSSQHVSQLPAYSEFPSSLSPTSPSPGNSNKGLNDKDTIVVESA